MRKFLFFKNLITICILYLFISNIIELISIVIDVDVIYTIKNRKYKVLKQKFFICSMHLYVTCAFILIYKSF